MTAVQKSLLCMMCDHLEKDPEVCQELQRRLADMNPDHGGYQWVWRDYRRRCIQGQQHWTGAEKALALRELEGSEYDVGMPKRRAKTHGRRRKKQPPSPVAYVPSQLFILSSSRAGED